MEKISLLEILYRSISITSPISASQYDKDLLASPLFSMLATKQSNYEKTTNSNDSKRLFSLWEKYLHKIYKIWKYQLQLKHTQKQFLLRYLEYKFLRKWFHRTSILIQSNFQKKRGNLRYQIARLTSILQRWHSITSQDRILRMKLAVYRK
jgi:hypothetical protein